MKITIVMGFFLPVPPALGGATEKTWHRLAQEFAARGHDVTVISRRWQNWPHEQQIENVRHVRLPGFSHRRKLWQNLALDFVWSWRVLRRLPSADIAVVHAVALPMWLARLRPSAGRVVVMPGRMPKGQYRRYYGIARVIATSTPVRERVIAENPALASITRVHGYPIDWQALARPREPRARSEICLGYIGRLHPEKGADLFVDAIARLARDTTLPPWRAVLCGPDQVNAGGGGEAYRAQLENSLAASLPKERWEIRAPIFDEAQLATLYRTLDVFCYPSRAAEGETFGVAVAEAMAAGAAPVVSNLDCFRDFVRPDANGLVFDHTASDAAERLAATLASLLRDASRRHALASAAQSDVRRYDAPLYADALLADFATLAEKVPAP
jgi:glycosyltransferase involved in cell wall biosynthesis